MVLQGLYQPAALPCQSGRFLDRSLASRPLTSSGCCRARTALKRVALWLSLPWNKMASFEALLAHQAAAADIDKAAMQPSKKESASRWVKVSAATVGAGALFAVTGALCRGLPSLRVPGGADRGQLSCQSPSSCIHHSRTVSGIRTGRLTLSAAQPHNVDL